MPAKGREAATPTLEVGCRLGIPSLSGGIYEQLAPDATPLKGGA